MENIPDDNKNNLNDHTQALKDATEKIFKWKN